MTQPKLAVIKAVLAAGCLTPLAWLVVRAAGVAGSSLGANPVEEVLHTLGKTGLTLLLITLAVTPARVLTGLNWLVRLRRMLGLFSFFYLLLHLLTYVGLDQRFDWPSLMIDVTKRPYITAGMLAISLMVPLAVTSTQKMQRRLGRRWKQLHRLIYVIAPLGVLHFWWQTKADFSQPLLYACVLALLLGFRVFKWRSRQRRLDQ
jgi:methionine sulfoxide reductase heme-binding subunit